jgi:hypothetical protein
MRRKMADLASDFSKVAHQWVHKQTKESVVFVMNIMKTNSLSQASTYLQNELGKTRKEADAIVAANDFDCCTGFVIGRHMSKACILTCCHSMKKFYSAKAALTDEQIGWFDVKVLCIHQEEHLARTNSTLYNNPKVDPRAYSKATVVRFDGKKDLMLLEVDMDGFYGNSAKTRCERPHIPLKLAESIPPQLNGLIMVSWPPLLSDTVVSGEVTHKSRTYNQVGSESNNGYRMCMIELNMIGREGCSGSPILNHKGEVFGLYHGRLHDKGYAVSFRDINIFLGPKTRQRILS